MARAANRSPVGADDEVAATQFMATATDMTAKQPISLLNLLTSSDPSVFTQIKMPRAVRTKLLANDFDDWEDLQTTTMCSADVLRELQRAVESVGDFDPSVGAKNLARKRAAPSAEDSADGSTAAPDGGAVALKRCAAALRLLTVEQLKMQCREAGLTVSGTKDVLIERLTGVSAPSTEEKRSKSKTKAPADCLGVDIKALKTDLAGKVKELAATVRDDWHDSWEETGEALCCYVDELQQPLAAVLKVTQSSARAIRPSPATRTRPKGH